MKLTPGTFALSALFGLLASLGPLSTDMYLPSLPDIGRLLGATTAEVQLTLSVFLLGIAVGQLVYGPLADRHGRKPVLIGALGLYVLATAACMTAPTIEVLTFARFIQALGGAGAIVITRAMVRDLYEGERAARELALIGTLMAVVPALAPIVGGLVHVAAGWRAVFGAALLFGAFALALVLLLLPETIREREREPISARAVLASYRLIVTTRAFLAPTMVFAAGYAGLFAFISSSSFLLQGRYGLSPVASGAAFGACVFGFMAGSLIGPRLTGGRRVVAIGTATMAAAGLAMAAGVWLLPQSVAAMLIPMGLYTLGFGLTMPQALGAALQPFPDRAGKASSAAGFIQMGLGGLAGIAVGHAIDNGPWPLVIALILAGFTALAVHLSSGDRA